jgi:NADP-dependent 3-hydroxy acid dehydrogenase YdfG
MKPLGAQDIADTIVWCLSRPVHVNIQEVVIFPTDQYAIQMVDRR